MAGSSGVGQTANVGSSTSITGGAAKVFREFKWGLLTLFLLMVVVIGLVYDGGRKKKAAEADRPDKTADAAAQNQNDGPAEAGNPPSTTPTANQLAPTSNTPPTPGNVNALNGGSLPAAPVVEAIQPPPTEAPETPPITLGDKPQSPQRIVCKPSTSPTPSAAPVSSSEQTYTVKPGDTLTKIANSMVPGKGGVKALLAANKNVLANANRLRPGMTLKIPAAAPVPQEVRTPSPDKTKEVVSSSKPETVPTVESYTVLNGDTLERIARKLFNDGSKWRDLYEWNREQLTDPSRLRLGQVLKVKQSKTVNSEAPAAIPGNSDKHQRAEVVAPPASESLAQQEKTEKTPDVEVMNRGLTSALP
jgi:nucleoid-associated protein YgaU